MNTMTMAEFETEYFKLAEINPSYRYGQHFLSKFVKDSTPYTYLWNEKDVDIARKEVYTLIADWNWNLTSLPVCEENWKD